MDPRETLRLALSSLRERRLADARTHLVAYREWRAAGGFHPCLNGEQGDSVADRVAWALLPKRRVAA